MKGSALLSGTGFLLKDDPAMTLLCSAALTAALAEHRYDPRAHPELLQLRQAVTSAGIVFDPSDPTQLHTAIEQTVDVAVDAALVTHMIDPSAHPELRQVRQVVTATGMTFDPASGVQLQAAVHQMIATNLTAGLTVHQADPGAHPEQKQVRAVISDAGLIYDPADPSLLSQAIARLARSCPPGDRLAPDGHLTLPGGLLLQWGAFQETAMSLPSEDVQDRIIPFPIPFPTACFQVLVSPATGHLTVASADLSVTGFRAMLTADACGAPSPGLRYLAVGS